MERKVNSKLFYKNNKPLLFKLPNEPQKNFFKLKILVFFFFFFNFLNYFQNILLLFSFTIIIYIEIY